MKAETLVRRLAILVVGGLITLAAACADEPVAPTSDEAAAPRQLAGAAGAEEEIFGLVYNNKVRITAASLTVTLQEVAGTGACIHHFTTGTPTCLGSQTMRVNPTGIRPGQTTIMWGWYNNLDTDTNPCRSGELDHSERHDENPRDGIPDSGDEKHCIKPGVYKVTLTSGSTTITRTVDHRLVKGTMGNGKAIEDPTVTHPGASNFKDTIVHLDVAAGASYALQQLDSIDIDNPQSTPTQEFAPGDTAVATNVPIRVNSRATTPQWDSNASIGRLLARVYWDRAQNPTVRTEHWNPDQVVRTHPYTQSRTFEVRVEATTPNRTTDTGTISSRARKVVVTAPVASVTVSPPFATITTQNGTKTLTATLRDAAGNILTGRPISWSSSNTTVATVSGSGGTATVTGKANGTAT
ncbi:MAG: Ig-like domain-containing protein, partial [Gemmatimonadota bacterium]